MKPVVRCEIPTDALLHKYAGNGDFSDCYTTDIDQQVSPADYIEAFYTTQLFKLERLLLSGLAGRPSNDSQAADLAQGRREDFAAWTVEARTAEQILLRDLTGRTRSWLMCLPGDVKGSTRLLFGSAVLAKADKHGGSPRLGFPFQQLLGFHRLYSRALLRAAARRLLHRPSG